MGRLILVVLQAARFGDGTKIHSRSRRCGLDNAQSQAGHGQPGAWSCSSSFPVGVQREVGLAILCPITSQVKGPFEVSIPSGSKLAGVVLADRVKNLNWRVRKAEFICKLPRKATDEVLKKTWHERSEADGTLGTTGTVISPKRIERLERLERL
jgi:mRNA interferase MazF